MRRLEETRWAGAEERAELDARVSRELDEAVERSERGLLPEGEDALGGVYAEPPEAERPWYRESADA